MGLFREAPTAGPPVALSDEERTGRIDAILERARGRCEAAAAKGTA